MTEEKENSKWNAVIGRSLAILAMDKAGMKDAKMEQQATFLAGLGLGKEDIASVLGSTPNSIRVLLAKQKKTAKPKKM
jgi:hypothetical protein